MQFGVAKNAFGPLYVMMLCLILVIISLCEGCQYANIDPSHTMCVFKPRQCSGKRFIVNGGLTCKDKDDILIAHNRLRQKLALGGVRGQPAALNMQTLVWDEELAAIAQRWADQCMPGHDRSRNVARFTTGQNVAAVWTYERDEGTQPDFETQIEAWFHEVNQHGFSKSSIDPFRYKKSTGHYTQMAWADTYLVGCGYTYYEDPSLGYTKLYVCNYAPGGNVVGGTMYQMGFPGQPYCVGHGLRPNKAMKGLCEQENVNYQAQCSKMEMFHSSPSANSISSHPSPHHHVMTMMTPPPPPPSPSVHMQFAPPPPPPSPHHHFSLPQRPSYPPRHPSPFSKKLNSPLKKLSKLLNPLNLLNHFGR